MGLRLTLLYRPDVISGSIDIYASQGAFNKTMFCTSEHIGYGPLTVHPRVPLPAATRRPTSRHWPLCMLMLGGAQPLRAASHERADDDGVECGLLNQLETVRLDVGERGATCVL